MVTSDSWALSLIENGYVLPFLSMPPFWAGPMTVVPPTDPERLQVLHDFLLDKKSIDIVTDESPVFYSRMFVVPKRTGV